ncbi:MAG: hypothetical protein Q7R89_01495 [bacterium]|nr:hypothetical protein [bacterium]
MKKLLVLVGLLVTLSPGLASAQTLTRADVKMLSPQLMSLFTSINTTVPSAIETKIAAQNNLFKHYSSVLGNLSLRLSSAIPPSNTELESMSRTVAEIQTQVSSIAKWRLNVEIAVSNIVKTLRNIGGILASAA